MESDNITWSVAGVDAGHFSVGSSPDVPGFTLLTFRSSPDYEQPGDSDMDGVYDVIARASDGNKSTDITYALMITNVNERPLIRKDIISSYNEIEYDQPRAGRPAVHVFSATEFDGDNVVWNWSRH